MRRERKTNSSLGASPFLSLVKGLAPRLDKLIVSSTARGAAKNVIKIDVLLTEPVIMEAATL